MNEFFKRKYLLLLAICFFLFLFYLFYKAKEDAKSSWKYSKYTVGYIISNWHQKNNNGVGTDFIYKVKEVTISKTCDYNLHKGTKYLVLYDSLKPSNYIMLGSHQLPDDIKAPYNGWKFNEIPIKIDSADLKKYFDELKIDYK